MSVSTTVPGITLPDLVRGCSLKGKSLVCLALHAKMNEIAGPEMHVLVYGFLQIS
jgi:hypothetical protein